MKRIAAMILSISLLPGLLSGCRKTSPDVPPSRDYTARELVDAALLASGYNREGGELEYLTTADNTEEVQDEEGLTVYFGKEVLTVYLENAYNIFSVELLWEDAAVIRATGASAFEIAVVRMEDDGAAVRAATAFMNYISNRQGDFTGYAPAEADMAAHGSIMQNGPFAALFICPDPDGACKAVEGVLSGESLPVPGTESSMEPITDVKALRDLLVSGQGMDGENLEKLDDGDEGVLNAYVRDAYGLTPDQWDECAVARDEASAFEVAVLRVPGDWEVIGDVQQMLNRYLDRREAEFDSASEQARLLHGAIAGESNPYVVLLVCRDRTGAIDQFSAAADTVGFGYSFRHRYLDTDPSYPDRCLFTQPNKDDMSLYDTSAIRNAWEKGDPSELSKYDRDIFDQARKVLNKTVKDGMSDYEKEAAVYEWMVNHVNYDWTHQDAVRETPRESFTPYGGLVNHKAVCLGYATTFQLLMDLAGVECITVVGAAFSSQEDHGWNMVRLNGEWYCVDVTWDANVREQLGREGQEYWDYFNVTSEYMADTDHQWDYASIPEAAAEDQGRG